MGNIIALLQEIFMLKEDSSCKIGLSELKGNDPFPEQKTKRKEPVSKELKISELMRRSY